jgi:hypothetical protein
MLLSRNPLTLWTKFGTNCKICHYGIKLVVFIARKCVEYATVLKKDNKLICIDNYIIRIDSLTDFLLYISFLAKKRELPALLMQGS